MSWGKKYLCALVLLGVASAFPIKSQQPLVGVIQGTVVDQKHAPIPFVNLTATPIDAVEPKSHLRTAGTDAKGFYQFVDVPPDRYLLVAKKKGYQDYKISAVSVHPGETVSMPEIRMSPATSH